MKKSRSVRVLLMVFACAVAAPLLLLLGAFLWHSAAVEREKLEQTLLERAKDLADDIDRDLDRRFALVEILAHSPTLKREDWAEFYREAKKATGQDAFVVLINSSLRQIVNTYVPFGQEPAFTGDPETANRMLQTKQRAVSNLFVSQVTKKPVFNVNVPILENGAVRYILIYSLPPSDLLATFKGENLPESFVSAAWDGNDVVLAHSHNHERYMGKKLPPELAELKGGVAEGPSFEGEKVLRAVAALEQAPWRVSIRIPVDVAMAPVTQSVWLWGAAVLLAALAAGLLAVLFGRELERPLASVARSAGALAHGEPVDPAALTGVTEIDRVTAALRDAGQRHRLLMAELSHRVRNILSVVQAVVLRSMSEERSPAESRQLVSARLAALAKAHDLLVQTNWRGAFISDLIKAELDPFSARVGIEGPELLLQPNVVQPLAMIVHELATNAAKYGALSKDRGTVRVAWRVEGDSDDARFHFVWQEKDGPPVHPPKRKGFGTILLQMAISGDGVEPRLEYLPNGVRYEVDLPMSAVKVDENTEGESCEPFVATAPPILTDPGRLGSVSA